MHETEIIQQLRARDEAGMEALLLHYGPLMRYIISPILLSAQDREECLSEVVMRVWSKIDSFDGQKGSWNAWLTAICRNTALNHARRAAKHEGGEELTEQIPSPALTPEEDMLRQERANELYRALQELAPKEKALFYRKYYYLQSTAQIASELGMTERAVEGKLYRIRKRLRKQLGGDGND